MEWLTDPLAAAGYLAIAVDSVGSEVDHYAFLADNPEFADVRARVAAEAVAFFDMHLR